MGSITESEIVKNTESNWSYAVNVKTSSRQSCMCYDSALCKFGTKVFYYSWYYVHCFVFPWFFHRLTLKLSLKLVGGFGIGYTLIWHRVYINPAQLIKL